LTKQINDRRNYLSDFCAFIEKREYIREKWNLKTSILFLTSTRILTSQSGSLSHRSATYQFDRIPEIASRCVANWISVITVRASVTARSSSWRASQRWRAVIASAVSRAKWCWQFRSRSFAWSHASSRAITASLNVRMSFSSSPSSDLIASRE